MVKKISYLIIASAILIAGYFAVGRLNYWERSVRIFSIKNADQRFGGRGDFRGRGGFERPDRFREGSGRPVMRELPDSIRARFEAEGGRRSRSDRNIPDDLRSQSGPGRGERIEGRSFEGGRRDRDDHGRGGFPGGKKIYLRNVIWFLAVFAAFTVITLYLDKAYCFIRKRQNRAKT
jgi:hypothetical protein